jgi:hypothetical protein
MNINKQNPQVDISNIKSTLPNAITKSFNKTFRPGAGGID